MLSVLTLSSDGVCVLRGVSASSTIVGRGSAAEALTPPTAASATAIGAVVSVDIGSGDAVIVASSPKTLAVEAVACSG